MAIKKIPEYIVNCLRIYDNIIISVKEVKRLGGKERLIELLQEQGYQCQLKNSSEEFDFGVTKSEHVLDHIIIEVISKKESRKRCK